MKKSLRCICAAIFMLAFCTGFVIHASAVERASLYLTRYSATVSASNNGAIEMSIFVVANKRVSELGASYILLEESDDGGKTWSTAREYEGQSWMTTENRSTYSRTLSYPGTIGHQYRVTAEVFAKMQMAVTVAPLPPPCSYCEKIAQNIGGISRQYFYFGEIF